MREKIPPVALPSFQSRVQSVHTLINFLGMKRVNTRGIAAAEKHVLMASLCYNLKKLLKFKPRNVETVAIKVQVKVENLTGKFSDMFFAWFGLFSAKISPLFFCPQFTTKT